MSRLLKILLYAIVLFFVFLWLSTLFKSCGSEGSVTDTIVQRTEENTDDSDEFFEEEGEEIAAEVSSDDEFESTEDNIDYNEIDRVVEEQQNTSTPDEVVNTNINSSSSSSSSSSSTSNSRPTNSTRNVSSGNTSGKYMVIAGSYLVKDNATRMQRRLKDLGYSEASMVIFDLSQYHSVVAARYGSYDSALKVSNELKRSGIDCYVHAQQN